MNWVVISSLLLAIATIYTVRLISILPFCKPGYGDENKNKINPKDTRGLQLFIFLGSGGHTGEMLRLLQNYKGELLKKDTTLHVGYSDVESLNKMQTLTTDLQCKVKFYSFKKAREVNSGFMSSVKTIIETLLTSLTHAIGIKRQMCNSPHLILLNGPGTCCIIAVWFKILDLLCLFTSSNIVYVESLARISTLSLTGKILYLLADEFIVQWEDLKTTYPRAKYFGILV